MSHTVLVACLLAGPTAFAADTALTPQSQGAVTFVSGGIGFDERSALKAVRGNYNLSLMFSERGGAYLSDVSVRITDTSGKQVLDTVALGPTLLANLPAGSYSVAAESLGRRQDKKITIGAGKQQAAASFVWP